MKIRPVGAELFHAARQTDRHEEVTIAFRYFWERAWKRKKQPVTTKWPSQAIRSISI